MNINYEGRTAHEFVTMPAQELSFFTHLYFPLRHIMTKLEATNVPRKGRVQVSGPKCCQVLNEDERLQSHKKTSVEGVLIVSLFVL